MKSSFTVINDPVALRLIPLTPFISYISFIEIGPFFLYPKKGEYTVEENDNFLRKIPSIVNIKDYKIVPCPKTNSPAIKNDEHGNYIYSIVHQYDVYYKDAIIAQIKPKTTSEITVNNSINSCQN